MNEDQELEETLEWLHVLGLPEEEFRVAARPLFENTGELDLYMDRQHKGKHRA